MGTTGPLPLVVFLHGYTASCFKKSTKTSTTDWPCRKGFKPIPNHQGFTYLQERLASQGYLTASISANGVNVLATSVFDGTGALARARLVHHHLDAFAAGGIPGLEAWPEVAADNVLLVGHSRGGEGVDRAVAERPADASWTVNGTVLIGTTAVSPAKRTRVPTIAFTGYCDGDAGPGPGQRYVDRPAPAPLLRSAVILDGANHNFFNTEWTPETATVDGAFDDAYLEDGSVDPLCAPDASGRLSAAEQQDVALRIVGLAASAFLRDESASADVLDGRVPVPVDGDAHVRVSAVGRGRTTLVPGTGLTAAATGPGMEVRLCEGVSETENTKACGYGTGEGQSVHWPDEYRDLKTPPAVDVSWSAAGGAAGLAFDAPLDLSAASGFEARIAVAPEDSPVAFDLVVTDATGASVTIAGAPPIDAFPQGQLLPSRRWGQRFYVPLDGVTDVNLSNVVSVDLVPTTSKGHVWVIDVSAVPAAPTT